MPVDDFFLVQGYPKIVVHPEDAEIPAEGLSSLKLHCKARGYKKPRVTWKKDG